MLTIKEGLPQPMNNPKAVRYLICAVLSLAALGGLLGGSAALAADEAALQKPIEFDCGFPSMEGSGDETFKWDVQVIPASDEVARAYDCSAIGPEGWDVTVWSGTPAKRVGTIDFNGERTVRQVITVQANAVQGKPPQPGEYMITLEMASGYLTGSFDLTAVVTANYELDMSTTTGRLNTEVKGSQEKEIPIILENKGTAAIKSISLTSSGPEGWNVAFTPDKIDSLEPGMTEEVMVAVTPAERAITNNYTITLATEGRNASDTMSLRVTVLTPEAVNGASIGITAAVIVGLVFLFRRLGVRFTPDVKPSQPKKRKK